MLMKPDILNMIKSNLRTDATFGLSGHPGAWALALLLTLTLRCEAQLSWTTRQLDFQPPVTDEAVQGDFEFVNAGASPVTVTDVKTSCGCTTAALSKKTYAPGRKGRLPPLFTSVTAWACNKSRSW